MKVFNIMSIINGKKWTAVIQVSIRVFQLHFLHNCRLDFIIYIIFLIFITTAFALGATRAGSPSEYNQPLDWFRLFCEIVVFLMIIITIVVQIVEIMWDTTGIQHNVCMSHVHVFHSIPPVLHLRHLLLIGLSGSMLLLPYCWHYWLYPYELLILMCSGCLWLWNTFYTVWEYSSMLSSISK